MTSLFARTALKATSLKVVALMVMALDVGNVVAEQSAR